MPDLGVASLAVDFAVEANEDLESLNLAEA